MSYPHQTEAQTAARIESYWNELNDAYTSDGGSMDRNGDAPAQYTMQTRNADGEWVNTTYTVLDRLECPHYGRNEEAPKALVVQDENGNIFVHFNGTGDGNWEYNADNAYGTQTESQQHQWAAEYLDEVLEKYPGVNVTVTGHSQGGNLAQYASMATRHGDRVSACVSLDGPNMSDIEVEYLRQTLGEEEFQRRVDKLYAYNGRSDYVSVLGQNRIIPDNHTYIVETNTIGYNADDMGKDIGNLYHACNYMLWNDGNFGNIVPYQPDGSAESGFRNFVRNLIEHVKELPPDEQNKAGHIVMKLIENTIGNGSNGVYTDFTAEELDYLKEKLIPMIIQTINDDPELAKQAIQEALSSMDVDPDVIEVITTVIGGFSDMPEERQRELLEILAQVLTIKDNKVEVDLTNLLGHGDLGKLVFDALVLIYETAKNHPEELSKILAPFIDGLVEYVKSHPLETVALVLLAVVFMPKILAILTKVGLVSLIILAIDFLGGVFPLVGEIFRDVVNFVLNTVIPALRKLVEALKNFFNPGAAFSQANPGLQIDTGKFRELAGRISRVNGRITRLDRDMDSLYWQVGLLDILDILTANLLTHWSPTLTLTERYLNKAADAFDNAENKIKNMFG